MTQVGSRAMPTAWVRALFSYMGKAMRSVLFAALAGGVAFVAGCMSFSAAPASAPVLSLAAAEARTSRGGRAITFPAGDYVPNFANAKGVFYLAPSWVRFQELNIGTGRRGGVFIPFATAKNQKQSAWAEVFGPNARGMLGTSIYTYPLETPLPLREKTSAGRPADALPENK